jgi:hypothetical protein
MAKVNVTVQKMESMGTRVKVKIKEHHLNLTDMKHNDKNYVVTKNLGRGRYIMKELRD